ncbi:MBL fold metallo-hydrolase [Nocardia sp. AG03]|uniref:MBL fold metallo-hydrolase n=1 Tax=Nocardia sp. AG03 TaxID=3025312 RepID=UPI0024184268|nr:MBL fold metallo-hydrolase [Nocardia sp. AG03]
MGSLRLAVHTSAIQDLPGGGQFSPTTSTLVIGPTESVLVDTQYLPHEVDQVIEQIELSGTRLVSIFVTHAHADHYFGLQRLLDRYPTARAYALPSVAAAIAAELPAHRHQWAGLFEGSALDNTIVPESLHTDTLHVDGHELRVIELPQADIGPTGIVHIPDLRAVVAGDVAYNGINPFLAATGPDQWQRWIDSIDTIAALDPETVIAGHKRPELSDSSACLQTTRSYIEAFTTAVTKTDNTRELVAGMTTRFPDHGNPSALVASAATALKRKKHARG